MRWNVPDSSWFPGHWVRGLAAGAVDVLVDGLLVLPLAEGGVVLAVEVVGLVHQGDGAGVGPGVDVRLLVVAAVLRPVLLEPSHHCHLRVEGLSGTKESEVSKILEPVTQRLLVREEEVKQEQGKKEETKKQQEKKTRNNEMT